MELSDHDLEVLRAAAPGNAAIYRLRGDAAEAVYTSPLFSAFIGLSAAEYAALSEKNAFELVYAEDRPALLAAVRESLRTGSPFDGHYRVFHKRLGIDWTHISARFCGINDGCPILMTVCSNESVETDIFRNILDHTGRKVSVRDCATYELLFANHAAQCGGADAGKTPVPYAGRRCYEYLYGRNKPCEDCSMQRAKRGEREPAVRFSGRRNTWEHLTGSFAAWCGHDAFIEYADDMTGAIRRRNELQDLVLVHELQLKATRLLNEQMPLAERLNSSMQVMLDYYEADRAYVVIIDENGQTASNTCERCREGVSPQIDTLQNVDISVMDRWMPFFRRGEVVVQDDLEQIRSSHPDEYAILSRQAIRSYIEAPIIAGGKLIGFLGVDNPPQEKLMHSSDLLLSFAYSVGSAIIRERDRIRLEDHSRELESIVNNIPVGISMIRVRNGKPVSKITNSLLCELYGVSPEEADRADRIAMARMAEEDRAATQEKMDLLLTPGAFVRSVFRYHFPGEEKPRRYEMKARSATVGGELLLFSCLIDVTAEYEAAAENRHSRQMYKAAAELAHLSVWVYDIPRRRIVLSDSKATVSDRTAYSIPKVIENVPESSAAWIDEADFDRVLAMYRAIADGAPEAACEYRYKTVPGVPARYERVSYTTVFDEDGKAVSAFGIGMDITGQYEEREKYRQSAEALLTANPNAIGTFRLNLTKNLWTGGRSPHDYIRRTLTADTADRFFENVASLIIGEKEQRAYTAAVGREKLLALYAEGRSDLSVEYRRRIENGQSQWVHAYFSLLRNPDTGDIECITYAQDVTMQHRDAAIFERITNQEFDYVALLHLQANRIEFLRMNAKLSSRYREKMDKPGILFDFDEIRRFTAGSWIDPEDRAYYLKSSPADEVRRQLDRFGHFEMSLRGRTDSSPGEIMCRKIQHYYLDGDRDTVLIIQTDVTETYLQQKKEAELVRAEAERVQDIMDSITAGISVLHMRDADHLEFSYVNRQLFRLLHFSDRDSSTAFDSRTGDPAVLTYVRDGFSGLHPDDRERVVRTFHDHYGSQHFVVEPYRTLGGDGRYHWLRQELRLRETRPEYKVFYSTYNDVEEEVRLRQERDRQLKEEKRLRQEAMAANAAKSDFLSRMSHDIRTPLNGIIGMTHIAGDQHNPPKTGDCLAKIDTSSKFLLGLVNDILDMAKAESGRVELHPEPYYPDDFRRYIDSVIRPLCEEKNQTLVFDISPIAGFVPVMDILRVNQVYFNLLSNAVKYTPEGGEIRVTVLEKLLPENRDRLTVSIRDNGIGMSEEFQSVLFEPFTQENRNDSSEMRGSGLGLAIVKKDIEAMGGVISVRSRVGKGTEFMFTFDCDILSVPNNIREKKDTAGSSRPDILNGRHILLCEDHPLNQEIAAALLAEKGMIVDIADNGQAGVDHFAGSGIGYFDAVLMDIRMPLMDGYEATKALRALDRADAGTVPVIAMTADAFADDVQKCFAAGMNGHVAKPIDPDKLYRALEDAIGPRVP